MESVVRVGGVGRWTALAASGWEAWLCSLAVAQWQCVERLLTAKNLLAPRSSRVIDRRGAVAQLERSVRRVRVFLDRGRCEWGGMVTFSMTRLFCCSVEAVSLVNVVVNVGATLAWTETTEETWWA